MRKWKVGNLGFFLLFDSKPTYFLSQNTNYEIRFVYGKYIFPWRNGNIMGGRVL